MFYTIINLGLMILGFGILIFVHELGHFMAAKWAGIRTQGFAIGMGPVVCTYRKGIGFRIGSTAGITESKVRSYASSKSEIENVKNLSQKQFFDLMDEMKLGETEYSLRWLPIGGFVQMLGQEDANPKATSEHPNSYQNCPVWKRMIVVSAGVIMNLILAVLVFMWVFMVGVPMEAPVVGGTVDDMPAAMVMAENASEYGITEPGLMVGDRVLAADGDQIDVFGDLVIAAAMAKPDVPVTLDVLRNIGGREVELEFKIVPQPSKESGLLSFGIAPAYSTKLGMKSYDGLTELMLDNSGLAEARVKQGMNLLSVNGIPAENYHLLEEQARSSEGKSVETEWARLDEEGNVVGEKISVEIPVLPEFEKLLTSYAEKERSPEYGLLGFSPLTRVSSVNKDSPNKEEIKTGDVILSIAGKEGPRRWEFQEKLGKNKGQEVSCTVLRDGNPVVLDLKVSRRGMIGVSIEPVHDLLLTADPIFQYSQPRESNDEIVTFKPGPLDGHEINVLSKIVSVNGNSVNDWQEFRQALFIATAYALDQGTEASVEIALEPNGGGALQIETIDLEADEITSLHDLKWTTRVASFYFEPMPALLTANGNPITAISMGFDRTYKFIINVYLTIDRLFRGSVGVEQLRGPVGIVHLGVLVAEKGIIYLCYLLAMISVNLAVVNFLPIPIVDGGLFLFLVYEKIKGRPPSIAFQNLATIAGLMLIVALFLLVTYNDIARLVVG